MLSAIGRISSGSDAGTPFTHLTSSERVILQASDNGIPRTSGALAAADKRVPPQSGQTSSPEKFRNAFHPLLVFDFRQRIFNGMDGIVIGKIQFSGGIGVFRLIENMLLFRRSVVDDILFSFRQFGKRNIGADPHRTADVSHQ